MTEYGRRLPTQRCLTLPSLCGRHRASAQRCHVIVVRKAGSRRSPGVASWLTTANAGVVFASLAEQWNRSGVAPQRSCWRSSRTSNASTSSAVTSPTTSFKAIAGVSWLSLNLDRVGFIETQRLGHESELESVEFHPLASRGERLFLHRVTTRFAGGSVREYLTVSHWNSDLTRLRRTVRFDLADVEAATAELDRLHAETDD
jgi:hypothetical protein